MKQAQDREKVKQHFSYLLEELPYRDVLDLFLMFMDSRPSCLLMNLEEDEINDLESFCDDYNFLYRIEEGDSALSASSMFIASEEKRLELLEKEDGRFCGFTDIKLGEFLGFPREDSEYFSENIRSGQIEPEVREKAREMISNGELDQEDMKYLEVASYVPKPEEENIKRCVETGSEYIKTVEKFDETNNIEIGKEILSKFLNNH